MSETPKSGDTTGLDDLQRLRALILGGEARRLRALDRRISDPGERTDDVAEVLPGAMNQAINDPVLKPQLERPIVETIRSAIKRDTESFAEALFPVLGPAIRRAVADALKSLVQRINAALEHSFTAKGLRWRLESARTGVPFAQIVLRETMVYAVQEVFLIQPRSGLVLASARRADTLALDHDAFSAMLAAIQAFIQDSFGLSSDERLRSAELGDRTLLSISGPGAVLACIVLGSPPLEVRERLVEVLELLHARYGDEFDGPPEQLTGRSGIEALLQQTLSAEAAAGVEAGNGRSTSRLLWGGLGLAALLAVAWVLWGLAQASRLEREVTRLFSVEPGYVVTAHDRDGWNVFVAGLRDPLAAAPESVLAAARADTSDVALNFRPYQSLDEGIVLRRLRAGLGAGAQPALEINGARLTVEGSLTSAQFALLRGLPGTHPVITEVDLSQARLDAVEAARLARQQLTAPDSVTISPDGDRLRVYGSAPPAWFAAAAGRGPIGGWGLDFAPLREALAEELRVLVKTLDGRELRFERATRLTASGQAELDRLGQELLDLQDLASAFDTPVSVHLEGFADGTGDATQNHEIALNRARAVQAELVGRGVEPSLITLDPGHWEKGADDPSLRKVAVHVSAEVR